MEVFVENVPTSKGAVQVCQLKWSTSWCFVVDAPRGSIVASS